jgi:hypothetical protein
VWFPVCAQCKAPFLLPSRPALSLYLVDFQVIKWAQILPKKSDKMEKKVNIIYSGGVTMHYYNRWWNTNIFRRMGLELGASHWLGRHSFTWAMPLAVLFYFLDKVLCFLPGAGLRLQSSYFCLPCSWHYRCVPPYSAWNV